MIPAVMRLRSLAFAWLALALGACDSANRSDWIIRFPNATVQGQTVVIVATIHANDCGGSGIYAVEVRTDGSGVASTPPVLPQGSYGLTAEARDVACNTIATGCRPIDLPHDGPIVVDLMAVMSTLACAPGDTCNIGSCQAGDGGFDDGGLDAGGDAGTDAGPPSCTTEGMACPTGGVCHAGGCCTGCWSGVACFGGTEPASCGPPEGSCTACTPGNACRSGACLDEASAPQFSLSSNDTFVRLPDGRAWGAGSNTSGQLGPRGGSADGTRFAAYSGGERFVQVASANSGTCGLTTEGAIYCWGIVGSSPRMDMPTRLGADTFNQLVSGSKHFCAIRSDGRLYCFGDNATGQLGTGGTRPSPSPAAVLSSATWVRVAAGGADGMPMNSHHTCGIQSDGSLWCWGGDISGEIGDGDPVGGMFDRPQRVGTDSDWVEVAAGLRHTCAIKGTGRTLWCWGAGGSGRLGLGADVSDHTAPVQIGTTTGWTSVAGGQYHSCGVRGGEGLCWGVNPRGQLGVVDMSDHPEPASLGMGWSRIWTGWAHSCGVRDGMLFCWGANTDGSLGVGDTVIKTLPTPITLP